MISKAAISKGRDRCIARMMGELETYTYPHLDDAARKELREIVLDEINLFSDYCIDITSSLDVGLVVINEEYLAKIDELYDAVLRSS